MSYNCVSQYNSIIGRNQWKKMDCHHDFNQEIACSAYGDMLNDDDRNKKYYEAIKLTIHRLKKEKPNSFIHVLDIGTGTGLLSMMAAESGADLVTACEAFRPVAKCAKKVIKDNKYNIIHVIPKKSTDLIVGIDMPSKANILVAELFDTELIGEGALEVYKHATKCLLTEDAVLIPSSASLHLQVLDSPHLWSHHRILSTNLESDNFTLGDFRNSKFESCHGIPSVFDIQASELELVENFSKSNDKQIRCLLESPLLIKTFTFGSLASRCLTDFLLIKNYPDGSSLRVFKSGTAHAFIVWWTLQMEPTNSVSPISVAPTWIQDSNSAWRDHWLQGVYFSTNAHCLNKGDQIMIKYEQDSYSMWFDLILPVSQKSDPLIFPSVEAMSSSPICDCGLHCAWPRTRISELNSTHYHLFVTKMINYVNTFQSFSSACNFRVIIFSDCTYLPYLIGQQLDRFSFCSTTIFHIDTSHLASSFMSPIYKSFNLNHRTQIKLFQSIENAIENIQSLDAFCDTDGVDDDNKLCTILLAEPFTISSILPWDSIYFCYAIQECYMNKLFNANTHRYIPNYLRICAVLVEFEHLWDVKQPPEFCEGFDITAFKKIVARASAKCEANVQPFHLWEYPCIARSQQMLSLDLELTNSFKYGDNFEQSDTTDVVQEKNCCLTPTGSYNGVVFWAEWVYDDGYLYAPGGPSDPIVEDVLIKWKPYGIQQGVYLTENKVNMSDHFVEVSTKFDIVNGACSIMISNKIIE